MSTTDPESPILRVTPGSLADFRRIAGDQIVTVGNQTGLFVPLTGADQAASTANLEKVIDALRAEIASLQAENAALQEKVASLENPPRSSDELASGVQGALDVLADKLGSMTNTTSNFAVREFSLESKVHVDVTPLGTIGFQFVQPGEEVNAAALSTVAITVVPVPKPNADDASAPAAAADQPLEAIDGLTAAQAATLRAAHVSTAGALARLTTRTQASAQLVSMLGIDREQLGRLTLLAGLLTVPGLDRLKAAVLFDAGVRDVASLAASDPAELVDAYAKAAAQRPDDDHWRPQVADTTAWVDAAKRLTGATP